MRLNTVGLRFTPAARPLGGSAPPSSTSSAFPSELPQTALSLRAYPANPSFPLGSQMLSALLELQADEAEVDEDGRRKEDPDQDDDKKPNNRANT